MAISAEKNTVSRGFGPFGERAFCVNAVDTPDIIDAAKQQATPAL